MKFQKEELSKIGLNENEINIIWYLIHNGDSSVYKIAKELKIPRSTAYGIINDLQKRDFVSWVERKGKKRYVAFTNPTLLQKHVAEEKEQLFQKENVITSLAGYLSLIQNDSFKTSVRYYEGRSGLEQIVWNTLNAEDDMYGYSAWDRNDLLSKKFIDLHQKEAELRGPTDHVIVNENRFEEIQKYTAEYPLKVRCIPKKKLYISGDTYLYNDIFAITFFKGDKIIGVEIQNDELVKVQISIFMNLWEVAEEYVPKT